MKGCNTCYHFKQSFTVQNNEFGLDEVCTAGNSKSLSHWLKNNAKKEGDLDSMPCHCPITVGLTRRIDAILERIDEIVRIENLGIDLNS